MTTTQIYAILITWMKSVLGSSIVVIRGEQTAERPKKEFFVIHQPMAAIEYSSGNYSMADNTGKVTYANHWQATISIEEIGYADNGDKLRTLVSSLRRDDIKSYFRGTKVSILRHEGVVPIPQLSENIWDLRSNLDLIVLFPDEGTYTPGYIETVEFDGTYTH